jgi:hypothetical protein
MSREVTIPPISSQKCVFANIQLPQFPYLPPPSRLISSPLELFFKVAETEKMSVFPRAYLPPPSMPFHPTLNASNTPLCPNVIPYIHTLAITHQRSPQCDIADTISISQSHPIPLHALTSYLTSPTLNLFSTVTSQYIAHSTHSQSPTASATRNTNLSCQNRTLTPMLRCPWWIAKTVRR